MDKEELLAELKVREEKLEKEYAEFNRYYKNKISMSDFEIVASNELYKFYTTKYGEKINFKTNIQELEKEFKKDFIEKYLNRLDIEYMRKEKVELINKYAEFKAEDGCIKLNSMFVNL